MPLDPFSVLAGFVSVLQALLGFALAVAVARTLLRRRRGEATPPDERATLLAGPATVLLVLAALGTPLLLLLLGSEVPRWAGVMCLQGVLRVGLGSPGPQGLLPGLLAALEVTKPALLFLGGAWLVLHGLDRATRTSPLRTRLLGLLGLVAVLAVADAALEATWIGIPKRGRALAAGCCNLADPAAGEGGIVAALGLGAAGGGSSPLAVAFFALAAALVAGALLWRRRARSGARVARPAAATTVSALLAVPVGVAFLTEVVAPAVLGRREHPCAWCLLGEVPAALLGVALFLGGLFAVGWAGVVSALGRHPETDGLLRPRVARLLVLAGIGTAVATLEAAVGLVVA